MELRQPGFTTLAMSSVPNSKSFFPIQTSSQSRGLCLQLWTAIPWSMLLRISRQRDCSSREKTEYGWPKASCYTYTFAWSPALVLIFAQSYQTVFVFIVFKTSHFCWYALYKVAISTVVFFFGRVQTVWWKVQDRETFSPASVSSTEIQLLLRSSALFSTALRYHA